MSDYNHILQAVRLAIETRNPVEFPASDGFADAYEFPVAARSALQKVVGSAGDLVLAGDACDAEFKRYISDRPTGDDFEDMHGARGAMCLKEQLHKICRLPQLWEMDADGIFRPVDDVDAA